MFNLPDLPYDYSALEPYIDAETMRVHHDKHHAAYVKNLNTVLEKYPEIARKELLDLITHLDELPEEIKTKVKNQAGGVLNHNLFWEFMSPEKSAPDEKLLTALTSVFSGVDSFREQFSAAAAGFFGSGWVWLVFDHGQLKITATANQDSPYSIGQTPLLGFDVWEHAYYLKYQNRRPEYISAWWNIVNWAEVSSRFLAAQTSGR
jgi:Fe-Mn family superoxide dismutase